MPKPFRLKPQQVKEKDVLEGIRKYLRFKGIYHIRQQQGLGCKPGVSDITGIWKGGKFLAIEAKRPGGKLSEEQSKFLKEIQDRGGIAMVAYSVDDVIKVVEELEVNCPHCGGELK